MDNCSFIETPNTLYDNTNDFLKTIFICSGVFMTGSFFALAVSARILFKNIEKEYKSIYGYDSDDEEYYDSRFLQEYFDLYGYYPDTLDDVSSYVPTPELCAVNSDYCFQYNPNNEKKVIDKKNN